MPTYTCHMTQATHNVPQGVEYTRSEAAYTCKRKTIHAHTHVKRDARSTYKIYNTYNTCISHAIHITQAIPTFNTLQYNTGGRRYFEGRGVVNGGGGGAIRINGGGGGGGRGGVNTGKRQNKAKPTCAARSLLSWEVTDDQDAVAPSTPRPAPPPPPPPSPAQPKKKTSRTPFRSCSRQCSPCSRCCLRR